MNTKINNIKKIFSSPIKSIGQKAIVLTVALAFIFMPQQMPIDWDLNTKWFWTSFPDSYANPNHVYPPWGLILMLPYKWMKSEGARVLSVLVIGWFSQNRKWSLSRFLSIALSPFFLFTMSKSNLDIFVLLMPILVWEISDGKNWQSVGWGTAMCLSVLKPQGMVFIWIYWLWTSRKRLRALLTPLIIMAVITIPISLVGKPSLFLRWLDNILNPSQQNILFWSINNMSITSHIGPLLGLGLISVIVFAFYLSVRTGKLQWTENHTYSSLIYLSFFIMPYTSQQSFSSAYAFSPSWTSSILQFIILITSYYLTDYVRHMPWFILFFAILSLIIYRPSNIVDDQ